MSEEKGLRFNNGKTRHDLVPAFAQEQYAKVISAGSVKYLPRNWEKGMEWTTVMASMKRHILAIERGEDYDPETGLLHSAHVMCNAAFLTEYYRIYPQGDDRPHKYLSMPRIGLDVDDVICDFIPAFMERFGLQEPTNWSWSYGNSARFKELAEDPNAITDFYLKLKPKCDPLSLPFEPHCYITSRSIPSEDTTRQWIEQNGFACKPVYTVPFGASKVEVARNAGIDIFVDDKYENFVELNRAGICCYLFDAPHNQRYDVGHKRLYALSDLGK
jgi:hypothetical protein